VNAAGGPSRPLVLGAALTYFPSTEMSDERPDPVAAGMDPDRLARVVATFRAQQERGVFPGGQLVVRRRGVLAVDEAVGIARGLRPDEGEAPVPYTPETGACLFSAGKPQVAVAVALLEDRGRIDPSQPVARYWPAFAGRDKGSITVHDVLTHRSGLYLRDIENAWRQYPDWDGIMARIEDAAPSFPRGTLAYQPAGFGWILGEVVRRVTGKPIARFLEDDVLGPAGLSDLRLGVPEAELSSLARSYWVDDAPPSLGGQVVEGFEQAQNSREWLTAVVPGAGTVGTARSLARFYDWLSQGARTTGDDPLIRPEVLARYTSAQVRGTDRTVRMPLVIGQGFGLGWLWPHAYGWWRTGRCYGHGGNFSTLAWADPTTGCSVAIVTNGNRAPFRLVARCAPIGSGVRAACRP
jgi:CubicO group peptidase (beta-lactamase class C family)